MEEAPSGSCVDALDGELDALDGEPEGGAVNVENEMEEIQHSHDTLYIQYICIDYCVMHCKDLLY
jgi:hypothetical protein